MIRSCYFQTTKTLLSCLIIILILTPTWSLSLSSSSSSSKKEFPLSRREMMFKVATTTTTGIMTGITFVGNPQRVLAEEIPNSISSTMTLSSSSTTSTLVEELQESKTKLTGIPNLLQGQEWDKVRNILKTPPVNKLWNLGDSQNTVLQLARELGDPELFELKDELSYQLQICDQLTYDNVFIYYQPGSGKINIKAPTDAANNAMKYLDQILEATK